MSSLFPGDCIEVMATLPEASVDAIVTDPPYGINFMGKAWDGADIARNVQEYEAKGYSRGPVSRGGGRRTSSAFRNTAGAAGAYDFSLKGNLAFYEWSLRWAEAAYRVAKPSAYLLAFGGTRTVHRMTCALEDAGWIIRDMLVWGYASGFPKSKASLKPAWEPIVMARKPGPLRMLNIDECRIGYVSPDDAANASVSAVRSEQGVNKILGKGLVKPGLVEFDAASTGGRWPANIVLTDPIFDGGVEGVVGGGEARGAVSNSSPNGKEHGIYGAYAPRDLVESYGDTGTYSRFFLVPKAARSEREPVLGGSTSGPRVNSHPTVKSLDLMRHLVRLVTPPGGTVLDPFLGSGTTALAAEMEGFEWIGIEREAEYVAIAEARLNGTQRGLCLA